MSRKYKFGDKNELYFVTFTVIEWIDVFTRNSYKDILLNSWEYCKKNKGLEIYSWCIMTNHVHMIISSKQDEVQNIMRDMKRHTSSMLKKSIEENQNESRKKWILDMMKKAGSYNNNNKGFQFWQQHNHPIILDSNFLIDQKLGYIHNNPVKAGFVDKPEDYLYSSARDYAGMKGLLDIIIID
ncbi:MAG: transposase [Bacteroidia bacterium]|nr:transposase [Bacteroidia bacterium]